MPSIDEESTTAKLLNCYAEIERLLFQSHEIVIRSSIRVSEAHRTLAEANRSDTEFRRQVNECSPVLNLARSS